MSAPLVLRHVVDIDGQQFRARLPMPDVVSAGRLMWQLVALAGAVSVVPACEDTNWCGSCGSSLYRNGTCPICDRARAAPDRAEAEALRC